MTPPNRWGGSTASIRQKTLALVWGDRTGLLIFLAALCLFGLVWRTEFLINDSYTIANGVYALEHGALDMTTAAYGPGLETPGAEYYGEKLYSRNYGVIFAALPLVWLLRSLELVFDLRIVLVATWCLLVLATLLLTGQFLDRQHQARLWGGVTVLALFAVNVALATPLDQPAYHLIALQIVHMVLAAFVCVFTYRLIAEVHERRHALLATFVVGLGTPLAFWAPVPKRHVITAAIALAVAFAIARSRDGERRHATTARALAYVLVGLLAWVHAPEALVLMAALVVVDVPTAPSNDARTLSVVGGAFLVSLLPMIATNVAITGNPLMAPRLMKTLGAGADASIASGSGGENAGGGDGSAGVSLWSPSAFVALTVALAQSALEPILTFVGLLSRGVGMIFGQPEQIYQTYVRSGYVERVAQRAADDPATNLSLLESAPVLAGLLAFVPLAWSNLSEAIDLLRFEIRRLSVRPLSFYPLASDRPAHISAVDAFVVVLALGYSLVYIARLPIHAQVTVRYLFPLYPLAVFGLFRIQTVRDSLTDHWRAFCWTYAAAVLIGGQLLLVTLVLLAPGRGEAFQFHALLGLATAVLVLTWSLSGRSHGNWGRVGATSIALATAAASTFVAFVSIEYYALGDSHALPMVRVIAELISIV